jgi:hypothetical protein
MSTLKFIFIATGFTVGLCSRTSLRAREVTSLISTGTASEATANIKAVVPALRSPAATRNGTHAALALSATGAGERTSNIIAGAFEDDVKMVLHSAQKYVAALMPEAEQATIQLTEVATAQAPTAEKVYFRPVSVTLRCVLALTFLFLLTYTALALVRNLDELSGRLKPSLTTETLTVAARSTTYAPMMAALFLACRMYVLQSTGGLGEPQPWAKGCMIATTIGQFLQPLIICILPLVAKHDEQPFEKLSGVACQLDVHPQLFKYGAGYDATFRYAGIAQMVVLLPIYGGVAGVIAAIFLYPVEKTVSPAVVATVILASWYFIVYCLLFLSRIKQGATANQEPTSQEENPDKPLVTPKSEENVSLGDSALVKFSLNATYPMDTAAMFAVLFLGARLRAVQMGGEPQVWAQICFYGCAIMLPILSLLCGVAGIHSTERLGYYGEKLYDAPEKGFMIAKHAVAGLLYVCMMAVVVSIYTLRAPGGMPTPPLSTTLVSLLNLSCLFFLVYGLHWVLAATRAFVTDAKWTLIMESTVLAAKNSVQFCPILAILFVSVRMRALQITQQKGDPQGWAQDAMDIILTATVIQIVCCLTLPIFTGIATKTDNEGNAEYDLRPLVGAYVVTCLKYFALFLIFGGVAAVGISMFLITPETARTDNVIFSGVVGIIGFLFSFVVILLVVMVLSSAKVIGLAVKMSIESADKALLGVDVDVGAARLDLCRGFVNLADVVVHNPEGYATPYLISVGKVVLKLNMMGLVKSLGKLIEVEALILSHVDIIFEKSSSSSNVQDLVKHLQGDKKPSEEESMKEAAKKEGKKVGDYDKPAKPVEVVLHRVDIIEVGAKVASTYFGGAGLRVALGDIDYKDFQEQCGGKVEVPVVIKLILETLMKTVLANTGIVGETAKQVAHQVGEVAEKAEKKIIAGVHKAEEKVMAGAHAIGDKASKAAHFIGDHLPFSHRSSGSGKTEDSAKK